MSSERTRHALVLLVVLLTVSLGAVAPAVAAPTDTTSGTTVGDALADGAGDDGSADDGDDSTGSDGSTTSDGSSSDDSATSDGSSSSGGGLSDDGGDANGSSTADEGSSDDGNRSAVNLTESVDDAIDAAGEPFDGTDGALRGGSGLSADAISALDGTTDGATGTDDAVGSVTGDADGLLAGAVSTLDGALDGSTSPAGDDVAGASRRDAGAFGAAALLPEAAPGGGDDGAPDAPTAGLALGVGAVAAAAVTRQGALLPDLAANLGAALTASAVPARVRGALDRLVRTVAPFRYSRYDDSDPLEHESRAAVFSVVEESPGAYLSELAERAGVPLSTARHHVRVLEREDLVSGAKIRGKRRFYPAYESDVELSAALSDEATAAVLDALARLGPASVSAVADEVGRDPSTVTHHLQRLEEDDLVVREREGRSVVNRLSPAARTALEPEAAEPEAAEAAEALASD